MSKNARAKALSGLHNDPMSIPTYEKNSITVMTVATDFHRTSLLSARHGGIGSQDVLNCLL